MLKILYNRSRSRASLVTVSSIRTFAVHTKFTKSHEWVKFDDTTKEGSFGITDYAQKQLGDIVFVDFPFKGDKFKAGDVIGAVESVKTSAQVYIPLSGEVLENNKAIEDNPGVVNESAQEKGWISKLKFTKEEELQKLLNETEYNDFLKTIE